MRILFTGGGTGGHIFPIIAVARQLKKIYTQSIQPIGPNKETDLEMFFLGAGKFSKGVLEKEGIRTKIISAGKIRRYFSIQNFVDLLKIPIGFCQALWYLYIWIPDVIFSKGGYDSVPVVLTGWLFRIPILTHESDTIPGLANRLAAKFSKRLAISFALTEKYFPLKKTALVGNPIRIKSRIERFISSQSREMFNISSDKPIIFILGGSQGAQKINELILRVLPQLLEKYEIIHQCGHKNYEEIKTKLKTEFKTVLVNYHLYAFLDENQITSAYLLSNLIISRAGAGSIFEIAACAKPSILIPLPTAASDHQRENAFAYAQTGATVILEQGNLTPNLFLNEIAKILGNPELMQKMSISAKNFSQPNASQKIAEELIEMGK